MRFLTVIALSLFLTACENDKTRVIHNNDRVNDLEQRAAFNDQVNIAQNAAIAANSSAISDLRDDITTLQGEMSSLQSALATEIAAREAGDTTNGNRITQLQTQVSAMGLAQSILNLAQNARISSLESKMTIQTNKLSQLTARVTANEGNIASLTQDVVDIKQKILALQAEDVALSLRIDSLVSRVSTAEGNITALQSQFNNLKGRVESLEASQVVQNLFILAMIGELSNLHARINELDARYTLVADDIYAQLGSLGGRVLTLENKVLALENSSASQAYVDGEIDALLELLIEMQDQINDLQDQVNNGSTTPPTPAPATCSVVNNNQSNNSYTVTVSNSFLNTSGTLKIYGINVSGHNYSGGGANASGNNPWVFQPTHGVASSFLIYKQGNGGSVTSATVTKDGVTITCTVNN